MKRKLNIKKNFFQKINDIMSILTNLEETFGLDDVIEMLFEVFILSEGNIQDSLLNKLPSGFIKFLNLFIEEEDLKNFIKNLKGKSLDQPLFNEYCNLFIKLIKKILKLYTNKSVWIVHKQVKIKYGKIKAEVDEGIAELILELWKIGLITSQSCQEYDFKMAYIIFNGHIINKLPDFLKEMAEQKTYCSDEWTAECTDVSFPSEKIPEIIEKLKQFKRL